MILNKVLLLHVDFLMVLEQLNTFYHSIILLQTERLVKRRKHKLPKELHRLAPSILAEGNFVFLPLCLHPYLQEAR